MADEDDMNKKGVKIKWTRDQEELLAEWSDKSAGYRWMHDRTAKKFARLNACITIPVIVLSTLSGTANFGMSSIFPQDMAAIATLCIGGVSLITGIISTIGNFLRYAQGMEAHHISSISWGKLQRKIAVELALTPHLRVDSMDFLKFSRAEMDRLIEQSPIIPDDVISWYVRTFKNVTGLKKPEICDSIEHTHIYKTQEEHVAAITARAATILKSGELFPEEMRKEVDEDVKKRTRAALLRAAKMETRKNNTVYNPIKNVVIDEPSSSLTDEVSVRVQPLSEQSNEPDPNSIHINISGGDGTDTVSGSKELL